MQFISESNAVKKESYDSDAPNLDSTQKDSGPDLSRLATVGFSSDFTFKKILLKLYYSCVNRQRLLYLTVTVKLGKPPTITIRDSLTSGRRMNDGLL